MIDEHDQPDLFASGDLCQEDALAPIAESVSPSPEDRERPWLTKERLFDEIEFCDTVCPEREWDGLHLIAQEMESSDFVPKNTTEQIVHFGEDEQFVVWEAFCPDWQVPDVPAAHHFAADWMRHHPKDAVIVDEKSRRITWRRSFRTEWVENDDALDTLSQLYLMDSMDAATECLNAAQLALGGF